MGLKNFDYFVGVCSQGLSFVDSPKGDLDFSGAIDSPDELVVVNSEQFPYGTTEQFPDMRFVFVLNSKWFVYRNNSLLILI